MTVPFIASETTLKLREIISKDGVNGWEKAWASHTTPWDKGQIQPPLEEVLTSGGIEFPRSGRALVPGCGKGYDAIFIRSCLGLETTGIDISSTAIELANKNLQSMDSPPSHISFELGDFFNMDDASQFDLVYDYTFFQALSPDLRMSWGAQMSKLVKPGGYLIILAFPTNAPLDVGPPWGIDETTHQRMLGEGWDLLLDRIPQHSSETHIDRDRLMVWRKTLS